PAGLEAANRAAVRALRSASQPVNAGRSKRVLTGSAPRCRTWQIRFGACTRGAGRLPQVRQALLHLRHALLELVMVGSTVSQLIHLSAQPGKFSLDLGKTTGEPGAFWRRALADLAYLPGQLADVPFDLIEPFTQFHVFRGGALLRPHHHGPVALVRGDP